MIKIKIKPGYVFNGEGIKLGKDYNDNQYTFWKSSGTMEVPLEIAKRLELERPQRLEIVDKALAQKILDEDKVKIEKDVPIEDNINLILDQVEKNYALSKQEQINLLNKLKIPIDEKGKEFDRVRKIILSGHKL